VVRKKITNGSIYLRKLVGPPMIIGPLVEDEERGSGLLHENPSSLMESPAILQSVT